jgi:hypothetical protein
MGTVSGVAGVLDVAVVSGGQGSQPPVGAAAIATTQVTLTSTSAAAVIAARAGGAGVGRVKVTITVISATTATGVFLGPSGVTNTTGDFLEAVTGASTTIETTAAIYGCLNATGSVVLSVREIY